MRIVRKNKNFSKKNFSKSTEEIWDAIIENNIATEDECSLVTDINGYSKNSLNDIIYARTGYHDIEQYLGEEDEEEDFACGSKKFAYDQEWKDAENEKHESILLELKEKKKEKIANGVAKEEVWAWYDKAVKQENNRHSNAYEERYGH